MVTTEPRKRDGAFRPHASGLIVPAEMSREREVWSRKELKALDQVTAFLEARGVALYLGCTECTGEDKRLERIRRPDGGLTFRCGHKDRHVIPGI